VSAPARLDVVELAVWQQFAAASLSAQGDNESSARAVIIAANEADAMLDEWRKRAPESMIAAIEAVDP